MFSALPVLLPLEVVVAAQMKGRTVLVICYLACVLADVKSYLQWGLTDMCWKWHQAFGLGHSFDTTTYTFDQLVADNVLTLAGPLRCRGMTADVVLLLGMKRQMRYTKYQGMMKTPKLFGVHFTRGRRRVFACMHDLTAGINLPPCGQLLGRGLQLGGSRPPDQSEPGRNADARRQLHFWS